MASPNSYPNGVGGTSGANLVSLTPLLTSGNVWYVSSLTGANAASPAGRDRIKPLATIAQAITNAAAGDIIVLLSGHSETLTASQAISTNRLMILGEGTGTNRPRFTRNGDVIMFDVTGSNVYFDNLYFPASASASTKSRLRQGGADSRTYRCYFESGASDTGPALEYITASETCVLGSCTFISTATLVTAQPESAVKVTSAIAGLEMDSCAFSGGVTGWSNPFAFNGATAITSLWATNIDLLLDADVTLATATFGVFHVRNKSGSARVVWAA